MLACLAISWLAGIVVPHDWRLTRDFALAVVFGTIIGVGDVLERHGEAPLTTLATPGAAARIIVNAAASALALWLLKDNPFSAGGELFQGNATAQVLLAGFGALALLRVSVRVAFGGSNVEISLAAVIDKFLQSADRDALGRSAATSAKHLFEICEDVDFGTMSRRVAPICLSMPEALSDEQRKKLGAHIQGIRDDPTLEDEDKAVLIASTIAKAIGREALRAMVQGIKDTQLSARARSIQNALSGRAPPPPPP